MNSVTISGFFAKTKRSRSHKPSRRKRGNSKPVHIAKRQCSVPAKQRQQRIETYFKNSPASSDTTTTRTPRSSQSKTFSTQFMQLILPCCQSLLRQRHRDSQGRIRCMRKLQPLFSVLSSLRTMQIGKTELSENDARDDLRDLLSLSSTAKDFDNCAALAMVQLELVRYLNRNATPAVDEID